MTISIKVIATPEKPNVVVAAHTGFKHKTSNAFSNVPEFAAVGAAVGVAAVGATVGHDPVVGAAVVGHEFVPSVLHVVEDHDWSLHVEDSPVRMMLIPDLGSLKSYLQARFSHAHAHELMGSPLVMSVPEPPAPLLEVTDGV